MKNVVETKTLDQLVAACHTVSPSVENAALQEAFKRRTEQKTQEAANALVGVITTFENFLKQNVAELRRLRELESNQKQVVEKIDTAFKFFGKTGNPFPMFKVAGMMREARSVAVQLGIVLPKDDDSAWNC